LPWNMTLSTNLNEQCRRGYSNANMNTNELIWGFQVTQSLLPRKNLTLSLKAVDLLNRRSDITRTVTTTARTDTRSSMVHSYFLATVSYRFRQFGGHQVGKAHAGKQEAGKAKGAKGKAQGSKRAPAARK
ncbi:MAG: hypothetical protein ACI3X4_00180, partial [Bacteroidaceae bacterium]